MTLNGELDKDVDHLCFSEVEDFHFQIIPWSVKELQHWAVSACATDFSRYCNALSPGYQRPRRRKIKGRLSPQLCPTAKFQTKWGRLCLADGCAFCIFIVKETKTKWFFSDSVINWESGKCRLKPSYSLLSVSVKTKSKTQSGKLYAQITWQRYSSVIL